jgi:tight adherence protein B
MAGGDTAVVGLAALAGGLAAVAAREALLATPTLARWLGEAVTPLLRAGREGYVPTDIERRRLAALGSGALLVVGLYLTGPGPLAVLAAAGPAVAASALAGRRARYRGTVERRVPEVAVGIADALAGGRSVRGALAALPASLDGRPAAEMARVAADLDLGASTSEALGALRSRMCSPRIDALVAALLSQQIAGGDVALLMRRVAAAAAERDRVASDARAATAQARFTGLLVVAMPTGAALFAELIEPGFVGRVLSDSVASLLVLVAVALQAVGFWAIRRLSRATE